jgi:hypothetical protein
MALTFEVTQNNRNKEKDKVTKSKKQDKTPEETPTTSETTEDTAEEKEETAIEKAGATTGVALLDTLSGGNEEFIKNHGAAVLRIAEDLPDGDKLDDIIFNLPEEYADPISNIMQRMNPNRKGIVSSSKQPEFTELRLFQGTGADPNRPENAIPGQFYLSSKENVGPAFEGTVLAIWEGRTMWGDRSDEGGPRMPVCQSMDRIKGSHYGNCDSCPNRPWKDNKPQKCANDVMAFMMMKDLRDIVLVRFQRTSEPAGRQLMKLVKRGRVPWTRWFSITAEARTSQNDKSIRWFVMQVQPLEGEEAKVPKELHPFCDAMCSGAEKDFIYSGIARIYAQAKRVMEDIIDDGEPGMSDDDADYGSMEDAPDDV